MARAQIEPRGKLDAESMVNFEGSRGEEGIEPSEIRADAGEAVEEVEVMVERRDMFAGEVPEECVQGVGGEEDGTWFLLTAYGGSCWMSRGSERRGGGWRTRVGVGVAARGRRGG